MNGPHSDWPHNLVSSAPCSDQLNQSQGQGCFSLMLCWDKLWCVSMCPVTQKRSGTESLSCMGNVKFSGIDCPKPQGTCSDFTADSALCKGWTWWTPEAFPTWTIVGSHETKNPWYVSNKNVRLQSHLILIYDNTDDLNHKDILLQWCSLRHMQVSIDFCELCVLCRGCKAAISHHKNFQAVGEAELACGNTP